jgi:hypothetical protein
MEQWSTWLMNWLRATSSPYVPYMHHGLEIQIEPLRLDDLISKDPEDPIKAYEDAVIAYDKLLGDDDRGCNPFRLRIPRDGDSCPINNDNLVAYSTRLIKCAGVSWWNWQDKITEGMGIDFDYDHSNAQGQDGIALVDELATKHPSVMDCSSKSGMGRHWRVSVKPMPAPTRTHHIANCGAILNQLSKELNTDLSKLLCSFGQIMYIYHWKPNLNGFKLIKGELNNE